MFIDTHAHLFYDNFAGELDQVIASAKENNVDVIIVPATDLETSKKVIELTETYDIIYGAVGVHPHETKNWENSFLNKLKELAQHKKIVAIGEIGLDYFYDYSPKEKQIEAFKAQINLALELDLPIIVHNRESDKDLMEIIGNYCSTGLKAQFHCFNGSLADAIELINMNYMISFTGNITFKNADSLREILKKININNLLLETDSPFLTPVPHRGKRNEPSYVKYVAQKVAEVYNLPVEYVAQITSLNAFKLFGISARHNTVYTYQIGESLYINVTNRCNALCVFCKRKSNPVVQGYNLKMDLKDEPGAKAYIKEIGDPTEFKEIVFCGYGEPTIRWEVVKEIARYVKDKGGNTRLNTNGHGNFINKRDITPEFNGIIDVVSISLNTVDPKQYAELMGIETRMFNEMITFAKNAKRYAGKIVMSIVSIEEVEIEKARIVAEEKIGAEFRIRDYF